ncbi:MAG TPA: hypothetical protein VFX59_24480 [Polyangiales bacterium]|nr:hypothetical protein [Polyangiales bacterium]
MFKSSWYVVLGLLSACSGCSGMAMRAPADVAAQSEPLSASDRHSWGVNKGRSSFSMGPYRIDDVAREPVRQTGYSVFGFGNQRVLTGYAYAFSDGSSHREGHCAQEQGKPTTSYSGKLACRCGAPGKDTFTVDIGADAKEGTLTLSGQTYRMSPLHERESGHKSDEPLGYRIDGAQPLGAVELEGRVWTQRGLSEDTRAQLVCMLSGLMLVRPVTYQRPTR